MDHCPVHISPVLRGAFLQSQCSCLACLESVQLLEAFCAFLPVCSCVIRRGTLCNT